MKYNSLLQIGIKMTSQFIVSPMKFIQSISLKIQKVAIVYGISIAHVIPTWWISKMRMIGLKRRWSGRKVNNNFLLSAMPKVILKLICSENYLENLTIMSHTPEVRTEKIHHSLFHFQLVNTSRKLKGQLFSLNLSFVHSKTKTITLL